MSLLCVHPQKHCPRFWPIAGKKSIPGAVVLAAGFGEIGPEGEKLASDCLEAARENKVRLIGPNTNGVFNLHNRMNLVGIKDVQPGNIGITSQSGNMSLAFITEAKRRGGFGFSTYVGVGNQLDVKLSEYLQYFGDDENTKVPVFYVEGFKGGRRFLEVCREVTQKKPVVIYKSGRTEAGQAAASSHTGALAGGFNLTRDLLRQAGATVVEQSDKILSVAEGLSKLPIARGGRIAILADGGGHATITADALIEQGLALAELASETRSKLRDLLPASASLLNPVDVAGGTDENPSRMADCAEVLLADQNVDILMIVGMFGGYSTRFSEILLDNEIETSVRLGDLAHRCGKPVVVQSVYGTLRPKPVEALKDSGVPLFIWPEAAVRCVAELVRYSKAVQRNATSPLVGERPVSDRARTIVDHVSSDSRNSLFEFEAMDLLKAYGVVVPPHLVARSEEDLSQATSELGNGPMAMKIVSQDILHKSDAGGVRLKVAGLEDLKSNYSAIRASAQAYDPDARIEGVLISPMAVSGVEVIIGVVHDPIFGPVMMFGLGGIFVEVLKDVSFRALPMSKADAHEMIEEIQSHKVLEGVRGALAVDKAALEDLIMRVSTLALSHPEIAEIDLNPVIVRANGYDVVDARMILGTAGAER